MSKKHKSWLRRLLKKWLRVFGPRIAHYWIHSLGFDPDSTPPESPAIILGLHEEIAAHIGYLGVATRRYQLHHISLTSQHRDSDAINYLLQRRKVDVVRGSSSKGGTEAMHQLLKKTAASPDKNIAIAVDGPRGPRREVKPGVILLAKRKLLPIYIVRFRYNGWRLHQSWDKNLIPKLFAKVRVDYSPAIHIDRKTDIRAMKLQLEELIAKMD